MLQYLLARVVAAAQNIFQQPNT